MIDREKLRAPIEALRLTLTAAGDIPPEPPVEVADQVVTTFRNDMADLGLDSTNPDQIAGMLGGVIMVAKEADASPEFYMTAVRLFDVIEPLLDNPTPWATNRVPMTVEVPIPPRILAAGLAQALGDVPDTAVALYDTSSMASMVKLASGGTASLPDDVDTIPKLVEWLHTQPWFHPITDQEEQTDGG